jgi:hypothetical protein
MGSLHSRVGNKKNSLANPGQKIAGAESKIGKHHRSPGADLSSNSQQPSKLWRKRNQNANHCQSGNPTRMQLI